MAHLAEDKDKILLGTILSHARLSQQMSTEVEGRIQRLTWKIEEKAEILFFTSKTGTSTPLMLISSK